MSDNDNQCCSLVSDGRGNLHCLKKAKFTYEGKRYCTVHYPPNAEKRDMEKLERYKAKSGAGRARYSRRYDCLSACEGVTFTGDNPAGIVKRMAEALREITTLYASLRSMSNADWPSQAEKAARAILSQVHIEPPGAADGGRTMKNENEYT